MFSNIQPKNWKFFFHCQAYREDNQDKVNPYRGFQSSQTFGLVHDARSHWFTEMNTIFIRAVGSDGTIYKVPYSFDKVPGSFTGEALYKEFVEKISTIKSLERNAAENIINLISNTHNRPKFELKRVHLEMKVC